MANPVIATGLDQPEGPAFGPDGRLHLVEMGEARACVTVLHQETRRELSRPGGRPTGLAFDGDGALWVAGGPANSLVRLAPDGRVLARIDGDDEGPFLFPNDLAFGPDGKLYMTDSGMRPTDFITGLTIRPDFFTAPYDGRVFQIDPRTGRVERRLAGGLRFANGLAFGPDGALYANESLTGRIYRLTPLDEAGRVEVFAEDLTRPSPKRFAGPDGMAFDEDGTLYCTVYGDAVVVACAPDGTQAARLVCNGRLPTNVAFQPGTSRLFVTEVEHGAVEVLDAAAPGLPLALPRIDAI